MMSIKAALRAEALATFRRCLRVAKRCPAHNQQQIWVQYSFIKFRDARSLRDHARVQAGISDAREQCDRMEYYQGEGTVHGQKIDGRRNRRTGTCMYH